MSGPTVLQIFTGKHITQGCHFALRTVTASGFRSKTDWVDRVKKEQKHGAISMAGSLFATEAVDEKKNKKKRKRTGSVEEESPPPSSTTKGKDRWIPASGTPGHVLTMEKVKRNKRQAQPPTFYPASCQISIWSVSSGIGKAALYRKIRAWLAKISRIQWGIEESPGPSAQ